MNAPESNLAVAVLWLCVLVLSYTYFAYPALIACLAALRRRPPTHGDDLADVAIVVVAHNEGSRIEDRIMNLLGLDYPAQRLRILIASDGSGDDTVIRARRCGSDRLEVIAFEHRRGKAAVLNEVVPRVRAEIVVLADARQRFAPDVLRALTRPFADPRVGAVSGELMLDSDDPCVSGIGEGVGFYWRYEKFIRVAESRFDSTVGATGAIYAIRKHLFEAIPDDTLLDDVLIPMQIARRGYRVLFEREARAYDRPAASAAAEQTRKVRTIGGNFVLFVRHPWLLSPLSNRLWFQTWSHKVFRLLSPFALLGAFAANLLLLDGVLYRWSFAVQAAFYAAALAGYARRNAAGGQTWLSVPYAFCLLNWATVLGFARFAFGRHSAAWERAD
jgi:biofilm PGA synthesis N-glycosyltransferase PgaC